MACLARSRCIEGFKRRTNLSISLRSAGAIEELSRHARESVLRVVQEALANVHRHADASSARVGLRCVGNRLLHVVVSDDGIGLDASGDQAQGARLPAGVGIAGMTARMRQLGGSLQIRCKPKGTHRVRHRAGRRRARRIALSVKSPAE